MGYIHGSDEIDLQDSGPVAGFQIPEGKAKLAGAGTYGKDNVINGIEGRGKGFHLFVVCRITDGRFNFIVERTIKATHVAAFGHKAFRDGATDAV